MFGDRLRVARKKAGLSQRALASAVEPAVTAQAISRYEANEMMPSSRVLVALAHALDVSLDFLMSNQVAAIEGVDFRKRAKTSAQDRAKVEALVIEELEKYLAVEAILGHEGAEEGSVVLAPGEVASYEEAEERANELRQRWNLGTDPIPSMVGLLEDHGVKVIEAELPNDIAGMTCVARRHETDSGVWVIIVSSTVNVERKRLTLAHELGHGVITGVANSGIRLEKAVNRFAGAFLVPAETIRAEVGAERRSVAYNEIKYLKHLCGVSASAVLVRLKDVGVLAESAVRYAFKTYAKGWRRNEPDEIQPGGRFDTLEKPGRLEGLVFHALAEELIAPARAAEILDQSLATIERGLRGPQSA